MAAFSWRNLAAAWVIVLVLGLLAVGGSALIPGLERAQAASAWGSLNPQYSPLRADRSSSEAIEMDD
jgi:hypothetical protein